jgi:hypothetical protein
VTSTWESALPPTSPRTTLSRETIEILAFIGLPTGAGTYLSTATAVESVCLKTRKIIEAGPIVT